MKIYVALCVERYEDRFDVNAEFLRETREEVEYEVETMLRRCISIHDPCDRFERDQTGKYDYILYESNENGEEQVLFRYKIVELEV